MNECYNCGFHDEDFGCTCSSLDKWYACPIESAKPENQKALEEYIDGEEDWEDNLEDPEDEIYED